jgi:magnesium chelatase family protein
MDIQITVPRLAISELEEKSLGEDGVGEKFRENITRARTMQSMRLKEIPGKLTNAEMNSKECDLVIRITKSGREFLKTAASKSLLSARGYYRTLKVAQTIADLEEAREVSEKHLAESFSYRLREV